MGQTKLRRFSCGVTFVGRFHNKVEADAMIGEVEKYLALELGLENPKGGSADITKPICECDHASECDEGPGCMFVPWHAEPSPEED